MLNELEYQIIALYSKGMTIRDIQEILSEMYGFDVSPSLISKITDRILPWIIYFGGSREGIRGIFC